jgi:hypothetical protein
MWVGQQRSEDLCGGGAEVGRSVWEGGDRGRTIGGEKAAKVGRSVWGGAAEAGRSIWVGQQRSSEDLCGGGGRGRRVGV